MNEWMNYEWIYNQIQIHIIYKYITYNNMRYDSKIYS